MMLQKKTLLATLLVLILIVIGVKNWPPSVLVILAGPTGGYFEKTALLLKKELKEKYIQDGGRVIVKYKSTGEHVNIVYNNIIYILYNHIQYL